MPARVSCVHLCSPVGESVADRCRLSVSFDVCVVESFTNIHVQSFLCMLYSHSELRTTPVSLVDESDTEGVVSCVDVNNCSRSETAVECGERIVRAALPYRDGDVVDNWRPLPCTM
jgi:hypothetical protein